MEWLDPGPVAALPTMVRQISGRACTFDANPLGIESPTLELGGGNEGRMQIVQCGAEGPQGWPIGLGGVYRMTPGKYGLPQGLRGSWWMNGRSRSSTTTSPTTTICTTA